MSRKKLFIVGDFTFPKGGAPTERIKQFALGFLENDFEVKIISLALSNQHEAQGVYQYEGAELPYILNANNKYWEADNIRNNKLTDKLKWFMLSYFGAYLTYRKWKAKLNAQREDYFLFYGRSFMKLYPFFKLAKRNGCNIVFDIVEHVDVYSGFGKKINPVYWDWKMGLKYFPKNSTVLSTITTSISNLYSKVNDQRILIPSIFGWKNNIAKAEEKENTESNKIKFLYVGALMSKDAAELMLAAFKILADINTNISLVLAGRFNQLESSRALLKKYAGNHIIIKGQFESEEYNSMMQDADALLLLRENSLAQKYSFPTRLIEYLRFDKPIVTTALGDIPNYFEDEQDVLFVDKNSAQRIAEKINEACVSGNLFNIGKNGWKLGRQHFDRKHHSERLIKQVEGV